MWNRNLYDIENRMMKLNVAQRAFNIIHDQIIEIVCHN